jgi:hypothetical protein
MWVELREVELREEALQEVMRRWGWDKRRCWKLVRPQVEDELRSGEWQNWREERRSHVPGEIWNGVLEKSIGREGSGGHELEELERRRGEGERRREVEFWSRRRNGEDEMVMVEWRSEQLMWKEGWPQPGEEEKGKWRTGERNGGQDEAVWEIEQRWEVSETGEQRSWGRRRRRRRRNSGVNGRRRCIGFGEGGRGWISGSVGAKNGEVAKAMD